MHYSDDQLQELLTDTPLADIRPDELQHLEQCKTCQQRLAKISGAGEWLNDLAYQVNEPTSDFCLQQSFSSPPNSVFVAVDSSEREHRQLECDAVHLDFLDSPTHPELMGRLGRYDIERLIGIGGFGIVFKARDSELNRIVAVKVLAPHLVHSGPARKRFAREAQASAAVVHEHVVPIHDVVSTKDICYLVMQFIPGNSLQERVDERGPLPPEDVLCIASQAAAGLHAAHKQGLIHRDVKPGNVLLEDSVNRVLISDFGLARAADDASLTRSGVITGTPNYMSPEQARGAAIDVRSDLFSLGSVIYFMCAGRSPFRAPNMMAVMNRICHESYRPLEEINPNLPGELIDVVDRLLSKSPADRFQDAKSVEQELKSLLSDFQSGKLRPRRATKASLFTPSLFAKIGLGVVTLLLFASIFMAGKDWAKSKVVEKSTVRMTVSTGGDTDDIIAIETPNEIAQGVCDDIEADTVECVEDAVAECDDPSHFGYSAPASLGSGLSRELLTQITELLEEENEFDRSLSETRWRLDNLERSAIRLTGAKQRSAPFTQTQIRIESMEQQFDVDSADELEIQTLIEGNK